jgi:glycosyltransferase involved in cell wall biosynthesis
MSLMLSVVICTHNRCKDLAASLDSLVKQSIEGFKFKVLVIDNASIDETKQVVFSFQSALDLVYCFEPAIGLSSARNTGVAKTETPYLCFIDDDAVVAPDFIEKSLAIIEEDCPMIFGGPILPFYRENKPRWFLDKYETRSFGARKICLKVGQTLGGSNIFFNRKVFEDVGFFDTGLGMRGGQIGLGEETMLQERARNRGISCYYYPELVVYHLVPSSKMRVSYIVRRACVYGMVSRKMPNSVDIGLVRDVYYWFRELVKIFICLPVCFFRDKIKYPYWQNYLIYIIRPLIERTGKVYSYFKFT